MMRRLASGVLWPLTRGGAADAEVGIMGEGALRLPGTGGAPVAVPRRNQ